MNNHSDNPSKEEVGSAFCDGTKGIVNYLIHQHIPRSYRKINEYLPHHLYYDMETVPFDMLSCPASNLCNRAVIKRFIHFKSTGDKYSRNTPKSAVWMPENDYIITAWSNGMIVKFEGLTYNIGSQKSFSNIGINCLRLSHNARFLVAADESGRVECMSPTLSTDSSSNHSIKEKDEVKDVAISANDNFIITGGKGKILKICSVNDQGITYNRDLGEHNNTITSIASSSVSSLILSGSEDSTIHLWDLRQKRSIKKIQGHTDIVNKVLFCPTNENYILSASNDKTMKLYDTRTYSCINTYESHNHHIITAAFHPIDGTLFTSGDYYGSMNYYSIYHTSPIYTVNRAHSKCIRDICFNPSGLGMVSLGDDSFVRFWQRNRPGDREELVANNFTQFKLPRNRGYSSNTESFTISRNIPSLGPIEDNSITTINTPAPPKVEKPLTIEEKHEKIVDYLEDDHFLPPRNYICVKCNTNGHWPHKCEVNRRDRIVSCTKCRENHTSDVCPYRYEVSSNYVCNYCKGKGHFVDECPRKLMNRKRIVTAEMKYNNKLRIQEGERDMEFPISIVSTCIPQDDLVNMTDFCMYRGKKYLLCAFENTITIYNQITTVDNKKEYVVAQIIEDMYLTDPITCIRWCKDTLSQNSQRGEFVVASSSFLTIYAPIIDNPIAPDYKTMTWGCRGILGVDVESDGSNKVAWSSDSSLLVVGGKILSIYKRTNSSSPCQMIEFSLLFTKSSLLPITSISISPDNRFIATTCQNSPILQIWFCENHSLECTYVINHESPMFPLIASTWMPVSQSQLSPLVLVTISNTLTVSIFEESCFSSSLSFLLRDEKCLFNENEELIKNNEDLLTFGFVWLNSSITIQSKDNQLSLFLQGHHHNQQYFLLEDEIPDNQQDLLLLFHHQIQTIHFHHSNPSSFSSSSLQIECINIQDNQVYYTVSNQYQLSLYFDILNQTLEYLSFDGQLITMNMDSSIQSSQVIGLSSSLQTAIQWNDSSFLLQDSNNQFYLWNYKKNQYERKEIVKEDEVIIIEANEERAIFKGNDRVWCIQGNETVFSMTLKNCLIVHVLKNHIVMSNGREIKIGNLINQSIEEMKYDKEILDLILWNDSLLIVITNTGIELIQLQNHSFILLDSYTITSIISYQQSNQYLFILTSSCELFLFSITCCFTLMDCIPLINQILPDSLSSISRRHLSSTSSIHSTSSLQAFPSLSRENSIHKISPFSQNHLLSISSQHKSISPSSIYSTTQSISPSPLSINSISSNSSLQAINQPQIILSSSNDICIILTSTDLFLLIKQSNEFKPCYHISYPSQVLPIACFFTSSYQFFFFTSSTIWNSSSSIHFLSPGFSHYLLQQKQPVYSLSLEEYSFYSKHSLPLLHPTSLLHLLLTEQFSLLHSLLCKFAFYLKQQDQLHQEDHFLTPSSSQPQIILLTLIQTLPNPEQSFHSSIITQILSYLPSFHFYELSDTEEEQLKLLLLIYQSLLQTKTEKDIDNNGFHFLLYCLILQSQVFPISSLPSSSFLYAFLSNSKDTLFSEALLHCIETRLAIPNESLEFHSMKREEDDSSTSLSLFHSPIDNDEIDPKYRQLFTFSSNRYNITIQNETPSVEHIEDPFQYVIWSDIRAIGLPLWYVNKPLYIKLALKMGMNEYKLTKNPYDGAVFLICLKKLSILVNLFHITKQPKLECFFSRDFSTEENQKSALKNAFAALSKQQYNKAICFLLLANKQTEALQVCVKNLHDPLLALFLAVLLENTPSSTYSTLIQDHIHSLAVFHDDIFLDCLSSFLLNQPQQALQVLTSSFSYQPYNEKPCVSKYFKDNHSSCTCYSHIYIPPPPSTSPLSPSSSFIPPTWTKPCLLERIQQVERYNLLNALLNVPVLRLIHLEIPHNQLQLLEQQCNVYYEYEGYYELALKNKNCYQQICKEQEDYYKQGIISSFNYSSYLINTSILPESPSIPLLLQYALYPDQSISILQSQLDQIQSINQIYIQYLQNDPFSKPSISIPSILSFLHTSFLLLTSFERSIDSSLLSSFQNQLLLLLLHLTWHLQQDSLLLSILSLLQSSFSSLTSSFLQIIIQLQSQYHLHHLQSFSIYSSLDELSYHQLTFFLLRSICYLKAFTLLQSILPIQPWKQHLQEELFQIIQQFSSSTKQEIVDILEHENYRLSIIRNVNSRQLLELPDLEGIVDCVVKALYDHQETAISILEIKKNSFSWREKNEMNEIVFDHKNIKLCKKHLEEKETIKVLNLQTTINAFCQFGDLAYLVCIYSNSKNILQNIILSGDNMEITAICNIPIDSPFISISSNKSNEILVASTKKTEITVFDLKNQRIYQSFIMDKTHTCLQIQFISTTQFYLISTHHNYIQITLFDYRLDNSLKINWKKILQLPIQSQYPFLSTFFHNKIIITTQQGIVSIDCSQEDNIQFYPDLKQKCIGFQISISEKKIKALYNTNFSIEIE